MESEREKGKIENGKICKISSFQGCGRLNLCKVGDSEGSRRGPDSKLHQEKEEH